VYSKQVLPVPIYSLQIPQIQPVHRWQKLANLKLTEEPNVIYRVIQEARRWQYRSLWGKKKKFIQICVYCKWLPRQSCLNLARTVLPSLFPDALDVCGVGWRTKFTQEGWITQDELLARVPILSPIDPAHAPPPPSNLSQVHFNIILPSTLGSSKWFLPSGLAE
jgi:hypothetical protein